MALVTKRSKRRNRYPEHLKRKIAKSYLAGEASYSVLAEEHGLRDKSVVREFVKWYKQKLSKETEIQTEGSNSSEVSSSSESELAARIAELERQLKHEALKSEMLETMIDIAEQELKIDIRKKSGTNQSKR